MKLVNKTHWRNDDLREIVRRVIKHLSEHCGWEPCHSKRLILTIVPRRGGPCHRAEGSSGCAYVNGSRAKVRIPTTHKGKVIDLTVEDKIDFAKVTAHELAHIMGHSGERWMRASLLFGRPGSPLRGGDIEKSPWAWAADMPIRLKEPKVKAKPAPADKAEAEIVRIETAIKRWTSKRKRCETALRKYSRKLKYHQKKLAASSAPEGSPDGVKN